MGGEDDGRGGEGRGGEGRMMGGEGRGGEVMGGRERVSPAGQLHCLKEHKLTLDWHCSFD